MIGSTRKGTFFTLAIAALLVLGIAAGPAFGAATISSTTPMKLLDDFADNGECSLREMVEIANQNDATVEDDCTVVGIPGVDTVQLGSGTYVLAIDGTDDANAQGDLDISASGLTIIGQGMGTTTIDGGIPMPPGRVLHLLGGTVNLQDLTITKGFQSGGLDGGGILAAGGTLNLLRVDVVMNSAGRGGGIAGGAGGTINLVDSQVRNSSASTEGGGIFAPGTLNVSGGSVIQQNNAQTLGGGISKSSSGNLAISDSTVDSNHGNGAMTKGGGIYLQASGAATETISRTRITNNDTTSQGGGIYAEPGASNTLAIEDSLLQDNDATSVTNNVYGGGLSLAGDGTTTLDSSVLRNNHATHTGTMAGGSGAGIMIQSGGNPIVKLTGSAVVSNAASTTDDNGQVSGGGIDNRNGALELRRSTVAGNTLLHSNPAAMPAGQFGAGIAVGPSQGSLLLVNSTVSDNLAPKTVGSLGRGAGIDLGDSAAMGPQTTATIIHSTVAGNVAGDAGGGVDPGDALMEEGSVGAAVTVRGSIIQADNHAETCSNSMGTIVSGGRNVTTDPACFTTAGTGDLQDVDPLLDPLGAYGGPLIGLPSASEQLPTQSLPAGSPAVNLVPIPECTNEVAAPLGSDERGYPRPGVGACDAGAYERTFCNNLLLNGPGPFPGCPSQGQPAATPPPSSQAAKKKCKKKKKKKKKRSAAVAKKKKCKKKKKKR